MKTLKELRQEPRITIKQVSDDGFKGSIGFPRWRGSAICSIGAGWEHVSVAPYQRRITPSWEDMCKLKDIFFREDEAVIQIHPPKSEYVNNVKNCLHLWRCTYKDMVLPPSVLVGVRDGQADADVAKEVKEAYMMAEEGPEGYIRRDALRLMKVEECAGHTIEYAMGWKACVDYLKTLPAAEVAPVVRCDECKYRRSSRRWCELHHSTIFNDDDFCSDGERSKEHE